MADHLEHRSATASVSQAFSPLQRSTSTSPSSTSSYASCGTLATSKRRPPCTGSPGAASRLVSEQLVSWSQGQSPSLFTLLSPTLLNITPTVPSRSSLFSSHLFPPSLSHHWRSLFLRSCGLATSRDRTGRVHRSPKRPLCSSMFCSLRSVPSKQSAARTARSRVFSTHTIRVQLASPSAARTTRARRKFSLRARSRWRPGGVVATVAATSA